MKRIFSFVLLCVFLLAFVPFGVRAAGSASLTGPSVVRAGDAISVTFQAGGGIIGGNGSFSYDSSVLTYQGYTQLISNDYEVGMGNGTFLFNFDKDTAKPIQGVTGIFKLNFTVNANAAPGTAVTVQATGVALSDGENETGIGTLTYSTTVAEPLSDNCDLKSINVVGATVSPAFSPSVTSYTASVPFSTSKLHVEAVADHEKAKVSIDNPSLTAGGTTNIRITVTAENGATKTYKLAVSRERDPNYVQSSNAELKTLSAEGYALSPAFDKAVTQYYVWLPYEAESVKLSATAEDAKSKVTVGTATLLPGFGTDISVTVTAEDGTQKVYTVTAVRAPEHDKTEQYLKGEREELPPEETVEPTLEPTEPTEETTEPTETTGETEPEDAAPEKLQTEKAPEGYSMTALIVAAVVGALLAAAVTVLIFCWKRIF